MSTRMLQRRGLASEWTAVNPILGDGEIGWEKDTDQFKFGDGITHWVDLEYAAPGADALATKADLVMGKVPTSQLPALTMGTTVTVASQAAMLALTAAQVQPGDVAIRSDQAGRRWLLADPDPSVLGHWIQLEVPDSVTSVNGYSGAVVLAKADIGLANVNNTSDVNKPVSTAQQTALDGKQPLSSLLTSLASLVLAGNASKVVSVKPDVSGFELTTPAAGGGSGGTASFRGARAHFSTTTQSIPSGGALVTFDQEAFDTDNFHSTSTQTSRFTIPAGLAGKYRVSGMLEWSGISGTGNRQPAIYKNGSAVAWGTISAGDAARGVAQSVDTVLDLNVGDYVELMAFQNSGSALNLQGISGGSDTRFELVYLGNGGTVAGGTTTLRSVSLQMSANTSIPNAVNTAVQFDSEKWDTSNLHDNVTNPSRITIPSGGDGKYAFSAAIDWFANAAGTRSAFLMKNGIPYYGYFDYVATVPNGSEYYPSGIVIADAVAGDYFELGVYQTSGAALNIFGGTTGTTFSCWQVGTGAVVAPMNLSIGSSSDVGLIIKGAVSQTADFLEFQNSAGTILSKFDSAGKLLMGSSSNVILRPDNVSSFYAPNASTVPLEVVGVASQTANLLNFKNSAGTVLMSVSKQGHLIVDPGSGSSSQTLIFARSSNTTAVALEARGSVGQTMDLVQIEDSSGIVKGGFDSVGRLIVSDRSSAARTGGAAQALPANPVGYFGIKSETGTLYYVPYYT